MHGAALTGQMKCLRFLHDHGGNLSWVNNHGWRYTEGERESHSSCCPVHTFMSTLSNVFVYHSCGHMAAIGGHLACLQFLEESGAMQALVCTENAGRYDSL